MRLFRVFSQTSLYIGMISFLYAHEFEASKAFEKLHLHDKLEFHTHFGWESKYVLEGRDSLDGGSLWSSGVETGYEHLFGGVWYGRSSKNDFRELKFNAGVGQENEAYAYHFAFTHISFPVDDDSDDEWEAGFTYHGLPFGGESGLTLVYSEDADGVFIEWGNAIAHRLTEEFELEYTGVLGWNERFVSDGHDGLNHFSLGVSTEREITSFSALSLHAVQTWPINRDLNKADDLLLRETFHFGISLEAKF
ncbi:MAG TPA: hypothetical protein DCL00_02400 [Opitutae bacterium]|nr:hypothetical protein [Opitutae bacterium]